MLIVLFNFHIVFIRSVNIIADLSSICLNQNVENVTAAAKCLSELAFFTTNDTSSLESFANKCFEIILNTAKLSQSAWNSGQVCKLYLNGYHNLSLF